MLQEVTEQLIKGRALAIGLGTTLQLQVGQQERESKVTGVLIGMVPDEYLLIRVPAIPGILDKLSEGNPMVVRYVYAGNIYGFTSTVLAYTHKPTLVVFISYPTSVESMSLRKAKRLQCFFPVKMKIGVEEHRAVIVDISLGGCRIYIEPGAGESLVQGKGRTVSLAFYLTGLAEEQAIGGRIQNLKTEGMLAEIGIAFDPQNEAVLNNVKRYIDSFAALRFLPDVKTVG
jgi:c-di-GMP-binding flagellar brake protein YcgR